MLWYEIVLREIMVRTDRRFVCTADPNLSQWENSVGPIVSRFSMRNTVLPYRCSVLFVNSLLSYITEYRDDRGWNVA